MYERLYKLLKDNESPQDFTYTQVDDSVIKYAEEKLGVRIPESFVWFLKNFGFGGIGFEVLGVGADNSLVFVEETLEYRSLGLPFELIAIENCDEWIYCINTKDGSIVGWAWSMKDTVEFAYDDFEKYLTERVQDILENRDL